jgi:hypothetical protein
MAFFDRDGVPPLFLSLSDARGSLSGDGKAVILAAAIYAAIAGIHYWLGYPVIAFL